MLDQHPSNTIVVHLDGLPARIASQSHQSSRLQLVQRRLETLLCSYGPTGIEITHGMTSDGNQ